MKVERRTCKCYYCGQTRELEWEESSISTPEYFIPINDAVSVICDRHCEKVGYYERGFSVCSFYYSSLYYTLGLIRILDYDVGLDIAMHGNSVGKACIEFFDTGKKIECYVDPDKGIERFKKIREMKVFY
jgi:hypothetical protein